jgi:hypothetical protein
MSTSAAKGLLATLTTKFHVRLKTLATTMIRRCFSRGVEQLQLSLDSWWQVSPRWHEQ